MAEIRWHKRAVKELESLQKDIAERILDKIEETSENPFHFLEGLSGTKFYKLRIGDYRIIVDWNRTEKILFILLIDKRDKIYKKMGKERALL